MKMFFQLVVIASSLQLALLQTSRELIPFEPVQYLQLKSLSVNKSSVWNQILEASPQQIAEVSSLIKKNLHSTLKGTETNIIFAKGERIISKKLSSKTIFNAASKVPYANLVPFLSVSMTILLEGFQSKLIERPIGEILKGEDLLNPMIEGYKSKSLLEILCMVALDYSGAPMLDSKLKIDYLNKHGEVALFFVNSILGNSANEAWMDALMAFNIENYQTDSTQLKLSLRDIFQYVLTVMHDFHVMQEATEIELPLQDPRYLFGWWLNCATNGVCVFPELPNDLIYSVSSSLRIYISPTFELFLIISDAKSDLTTLKDVIDADKKIWKQIYSVLDEDATLEESTTASVSVAADNTDLLVVGFIHRAWPIFVFIFWVVSSHIWVYWMLHCCWFVATAMSKRTHVSRPQVAAK